MKWNELIDLKQLEEIQEQSKSTPVLIYKHSTRCPTSRLVLDKLERRWEQDAMQQMRTYYLDLLSYREVSNKIEEIFDVVHQSPQVLIIKDGKAVYDSSHYEIEYERIKENMER